MRLARYVCLTLLLGASLLAMAMISTRPRIDGAGPTAEDVAIFKAVIEPVRARSGNAPVAVRFDDRQWRAAAALANSALPPLRVGARYEQGVARLSAAYPVTSGLWLNGRIELSEGRPDWPTVRGTLGVVPLPAAFLTPLSHFAVKVARWRYPGLPAPEQVIHAVAFKPDAVVVDLSIPADTKIYARLTQALGKGPDTAAVETIYCALAQAQKAKPSAKFADHVHRAFSPPASDPVAANRAALMALPLFLGEPRSLRLFGGLTENMTRCGTATPMAITFAGREDTPHHWAVSAALAAAVGQIPTAAIGGWKELSDSNAGGSGYSFVDLAADKSGDRYGGAAVDPARAAAMRARLTTITDEQLLPSPLRALVENLPSADFERMFGSERSPRYIRMTKHIDAVLDRAGVPR